MKREEAYFQTEEGWILNYEDLLSSLPDEDVLEILQQLKDVPALKTLCQVSKRFQSLCQDRTIQKRFRAYEKDLIWLWESFGLITPQMGSQLPFEEIDVGFRAYIGFRKKVIFRYEGLSLSASSIWAALVAPEHGPLDVFSEETIQNLHRHYFPDEPWSSEVAAFLPDYITEHLRIYPTAHPRSNPIEYLLRGILVPIEFEITDMGVELHGNWDFLSVRDMERFALGWGVFDWEEGGRTPPNAWIAGILEQQNRLLQELQDQGYTWEDRGVQLVEALKVDPEEIAFLYESTQ